MGFKDGWRRCDTHSYSILLPIASNECVICVVDDTHYDKKPLSERTSLLKCGPTTSVDTCSTSNPKYKIPKHQNAKIPKCKMCFSHPGKYENTNFLKAMNRNEFDFNQSASYL